MADVFEPSNDDIQLDVDGPEDEEFDPNHDSLYLKYCFDGAASISELAALLRGLADSIEHLERDGWSLDGDVEGGWAHLRRSSSVGQG